MTIESSDPLNRSKLVTVFGGSGFVGRHLVSALAKRGYRVRVAVRHPTLAHYLQPLGNMGQIHAIQANLRYPNSVDHAIKGADCVVNLVGILYESGHQNFNAVQISGAQTIAKAAKAEDVPLVHISAIGADAESSSLYARTKADGEKMVRNLLPDAVIMRSSIIFGPEDEFFNRFANMARFSPFLPLIGGGKTKFQPIYVGDVAQALTYAVDGALKKGATYELGGPEIFTFRHLMETMLQVIQRKRLLVSIPWFAARLIGTIAGLLPKPLLTRDQIYLLRQDNVVSQKAIKEGYTLEGIGIHPTTIEAILPSYLWRYRKEGQFSKKDNL